MKIAFDCIGTLLGHNEKYVLMLLQELQKRGHQIVIWSNSFGYTLDAVKKHELSGIETMSKYSKDGYREVFDYAVEDDRGQTYLSANKFIWVDDIPKAMGGVIKLADEMEKK